MTTFGREVTEIVTEAASPQALGPGVRTHPQIEFRLLRLKLRGCACRCENRQARDWHDGCSTPPRPKTGSGMNADPRRQLPLVRSRARERDGAGRPVAVGANVLKAR